jgi:dsDNA-specific endonuclease/ATPase MutS2
MLSWLRELFRRDRTVEVSRAVAELEETDVDPFDPFNPFPEPVQIPITDVIDLHTISPRDVSRVVEEYLAQARRAGFRSVRIIHGKGIGVQREIVRSILARTPFVADWTDAPAEAGGWGATVVRMKVE